MDNVRTRVLAAAMDLVNGQRESDYGTPQESFLALLICGLRIWAIRLRAEMSA